MDPCVQLDQSLFGTTPGVDLRAELERPFGQCWVARMADETGRVGPVGYLATWLVADELHVLNIATEPAHRRKGVARALMDQALHTAHEHGVRLVVLEVRKSNAAAIGLYASLGFEMVRVRRGYYGHGREDALEMVLVLDAHADGRRHQTARGGDTSASR